MSRDFTSMSLISCASILIPGDKCGFLLIVRVNHDFIIPGECVHERHEFVPASAKRLMCGSCKLSFGQALLRSEKSTHTRHFPFFLLATTGLASQSAYLTSVMDPTLRSFPTSSLAAPARPGPNFRLFCLTGLKVGSTFSLWHVTLISIPGMSSAAHANKCKFFLRQAMSSFFRDSLTPISMQRAGNASSKHTKITGSQVSSRFATKALVTRDCQKHFGFMLF